CTRIANLLSPVVTLNTAFSRYLSRSSAAFSIFHSGSASCASPRIRSSCSSGFSRANAVTLQLLEAIIEYREQQVGVLVRKRHRRPHLQDVVVLADLADQDASVSHRVNQLACFSGRGFARFPVAHELGAEEQATAPKVADQRMARREFGETLL